jgi:hypothetical protein
MTVETPATPVQNPQKIYHDPAEIMKDRRLSEKKKLQALQDLEADQKALLRAEDENMSGGTAENSSSPGDMLKKIQLAERKLESEHPDGDAK